MTNETIRVTYDAAQSSAVLTFPNGRTLKLSNITEEKANKFAREHGPEFQRRDCVLHTGGELMTRGSRNG